MHTNSICKPSCSFDDLRIGPSHPTFIVAELGINHNGDMTIAKEAVHAAAEAGASSIKLQNYITDDFITDRTLSISYKSQGEAVVESQYDLFKRCELSIEQLLEVKSYCDYYNINFHSTPTSLKGIEDLLSIGVKVLKNGSDFLTNLDFVAELANAGLPTVLSTGMATIAEIDDAVQVFRRNSTSELLLLHCTSSYPTNAKEVNLKRISSLSSAFGCPTGFSDHTVGITAAVGAVAHGACWIEKHFTVDHDLPGPDHWFSMNPTELSLLVKSIREVEQMLGSSSIEPTLSEKESRTSFRLSCVAARDIDINHCITPADICYSRPGDGFPPSQKPFLIGLRTTCPIKKGAIITPDHFSS